jgi:hypothetical protein
MEEHKKDVSINTRYPQGVRDAMKQLAKEHGRSFNGEVIWALRAYIKSRQEGGKDRDAHEGV